MRIGEAHIKDKESTLQHELAEFTLIELASGPLTIQSPIATTLSH